MTVKKLERRVNDETAEQYYNRILKLDNLIKDQIQDEMMFYDVTFPDDDGRAGECVLFPAVLVANAHEAYHYARFLLNNELRAADIVAGKCKRMYSGNGVFVNEITDKWQVTVDGDDFYILERIVD